MIVFCLCPFAMAAANGKPAMAGPSGTIKNLFQWGIPYVIGRVYLSDLRSLRDLATGMLIGAAVYLPLVWYELRMSPQLHRTLYGFHQWGFAHVFRYGGYRPRVFLNTEIMLSTWLAAATVVGLYLWMSKSRLSLWRVPMVLLVPLLLITTILCKCGTGYMQLAIGIPVAIATRWLRTRIPLLILVIAPLIYISVRVAGIWDGSEAVAVVQVVEQRSGDSLLGRMTQEQGYVKQALKRPFFGSGDDRFMRDDQGDRMFRGIEAFWVISLGLHGLVSVVCIYVAFLVPAIVVICRIPRAAWVSPIVAPAIALVHVTAMYASDCLFNGHLNPVYVLALGGLSGLAGLSTTAASIWPVGGLHGGPARIPVELTW
jgi:hypothetical protein